MPDLSQLKAHEFESLCYDLLDHMGFKDLEWRKGQNAGCSSSDSGRDIQGAQYRIYIDGQVIQETWYVECKHWKPAVPPTAISALFTWASAERPDVVLVASSGALSNPAHDWIESYRANNNPPFKTKVWEEKALSALLSEYPDILLRFGIATRATSPNLLALWRDLNYHTLDHLFALLDRMDGEARNRMLAYAYRAVLPYRIGQPVTGDESLKELDLDPPDYLKLKGACRHLVQKCEVSENFIAYALVSQVSRWLAFFADPIDAERALENCQRDMARMEEEIKRVGAGEDFEPAVEGMTREKHLETLEACVDRFRTQIANAEERLAASKDLLEQWERDVLVPFVNEDQLKHLRRAME